MVYVFCGCCATWFGVLCALLEHVLAKTVSQFTVMFNEEFLIDFIVCAVILFCFVYLGVAKGSCWQEKWVWDSGFCLF